MTPAQQTALTLPCYLAAETAQSRYRHVLTGAWSLVLTVNTGYE